jgi:hypothetical protein
MTEANLPDGARLREDAAPWWPFLVLVVLVLGAVSYRAVTVSSYTGVDELQHVDVIQKYSDRELPGYGAKVGETVSRDVACRGVDPPDVAPPPDEPSRTIGTCKGAVRLPEGGQSYEAGQPPVYYWLGAVANAAMRIVGLDGANLIALRLVNLLWVTATMCALWLWLRVNVEWRIASVVMAGCFLNPAVIEVTAAVSNDVSVLLIGALLAVWALRDTGSDRRHLLVGLALGVVAALSKSTTLLPVLAAAGTAVTIGLSNRRRSWRTVLPGAVPLVGWIAGTGLWAIVVWARSSVLPPDLPPFNGMHADFLTTLVQSMKPVSPLELSYAPGINSDSVWTYQLLLAVATPLVLIGVGGSVLRWRTVWGLVEHRSGDRRSVRVVVAFWSGVVLLVSGVLVATMSRIATHVTHAMQPRFGIGMVGFLCLTLAINSDITTDPGDRRRWPGPAFPLAAILAVVSIVALGAYLGGIG